MGHRSVLLLREPALRTIFEVLPLNEDSSSISRVQLTESLRSIMPFITGEVGEEVVTAISSEWFVLSSREVIIWGSRIE